MTQQGRIGIYSMTNELSAATIVFNKKGRLTNKRHEARPWGYVTHCNTSYDIRTEWKSMITNNMICVWVEMGMSSTKFWKE